MKALFSALLLFSSCWLNAATYTAAQDPWPPFIKTDGDPGISVEIVRAALESQGHQMEMKILPWARALDSVKKGSIDILVATWFTEERTAFLRYSEPYGENSIKFIKRKGDGFEFNGMDSLSGKKVGIIRGYGYGTEFLNAGNFTRPETQDLIANVKKLIANRIDLTLEDEIVARSLMAKHPGMVDKIEFTSNALSVNKLYVTSGTANANSEAIIDAFNKGLEAIKANGTYDAILKKYASE